MRTLSRAISSLIAAIGIILASVGTAAAQPGTYGGTPNGDTWYVRNAEGKIAGIIAWRDYDADNPSEDMDDIGVQDYRTDGYYIEVLACWNGECYAKNSYGKVEWLDIGNPRVGDYIVVRACMRRSDDGAIYRCKNGVIVE
ncbi:hypothetical protein [Salininema proteolyticum]|uniref:Uncharacterized protein n=1 Tax=Salininema proteolyticum TaxID=1607685 RepID=A0ABV8U3N2_9ACTN